MMRGQSRLWRTARSAHVWRRPSRISGQCRTIRISAAPTTEAPGPGDEVFSTPTEGSRDAADARFEVIGSPYPLLSVTLSASQRLYTRRGTLVAVAGKAENAQSTLSILSPLTRAFLGVPFLYQRISSTTPMTALIGTKSQSTTYQVVPLDGTTDWIIAQRNALLAWTGHTLSARPRISRGLSLAHWGNTLLTGRGVAALSAPGQIYGLELAKDEEFIAHPAHVVAYAVARHAPQPFRLKSSALRLQVPSPAGWFPESTFLRNMRDTDTYRFLAKLLYSLRTAARRTIWGDRLFLHFRGPTTVLLSSRGVRVADVLSARQVEEIADAPAGTVPKAVELATAPREEGVSTERAEERPAAIHVASVGRDGKVTFEDAKDLKEFVR